MSRKSKRTLLICCSLTVNPGGANNGYLISASNGHPLSDQVAN